MENKRHDIIFDIETTGLLPYESKVVGIGVRTEEEQCTWVSKDEKLLLEKFWAFLSKHDQYRLLGFNSSSFDIPFVNVRSLVHGIPTQDVRGKNLDIRYILNYGKSGKGKLIDYTELLGLGTKTKSVDGSKVPKLYEQGRLTEIENYLHQDVKITFGLYERMRRVHLL